MLSESQITKYQEIYKNNFGKEISREEACSQGVRLVNLMRVICGPDKKQEKDNNN